MAEPTVQTTVSDRLVDSDKQDTHLYDPSMHDNQIVALYDTRADAEAAKEKLLAAGVDSSAVQVTDREADTMAGGVNYEAGDQGLWGSIKSMFMPDEDAHAYSHAVRAGHAMVVVSPNQTSNRTHIIEVLESTNPIDFDAKLAEWRQAGYQYDNTDSTAEVASIPAATPVAAPMPATLSTTPAPRTEATTGTVAATTGGDTIKVMEERLRVGKREVAAGAVRIRSYVVERPVEEQVRLHEERVTIERRPVDREVTAADAAAFGERTIEASATREEAVVSKEARVVEEIGLHKDATDRTETVKDTVRSTKVDIEDGTKTSGATTGTSVTGSTGGTSSGTMGTGGTTTNPTAGATTSGMNAPRK